MPIPDILDRSIFLDTARSAGPIFHDMDRTLTPSTTKKNGKSVGSLAVHVINVLLTHVGNTVLDTCPHACAVRACIRRYCPGAWSIIFTYKRVVCVCLLVCWFVCFLSATRHLSTLRRCLRVAERAGAVVAGGPARRAGASMHSESTRAHAVQLLNEKIAALMPFKNN